jgi:hypothetical protein
LGRDERGGERKEDQRKNSEKEGETEREIERRGIWIGGEMRERGREREIERGSAKLSRPTSKLGGKK